MVRDQSPKQLYNVQINLTSFKLDFQKPNTTQHPLSLHTHSVYIGPTLLSNVLSVPVSPSPPPNYIHCVCVCVHWIYILFIIIIKIDKTNPHAFTTRTDSESIRSGRRTYQLSTTYMLQTRKQQHYTHTWYIAQANDVDATPTARHLVCRLLAGCLQCLQFRCCIMHSDDDDNNTNHEVIMCNECLFRIIDVVVVVIVCVCVVTCTSHGFS